MTGFPYAFEMNPYWNVIITMSTVGYGDMIPVTHYGRAFSVFSMLCGQFTTSLILLGMSLASGLVMEEQKAFRSFMTVEYHVKQMKMAAKMIGIMAHIRLLKKGFKVKRYVKIGPVKALSKLSIQLEILARKSKSNRE